MARLINVNVKEKLISSNHISHMSSINNEMLYKEISDLIKCSWDKIAPFWPLENLVAVNPLQGLTDLPIEEALVKGAAYFQPKSLPKPMEAINRETIKWMQAFFDEGQASIPMPLRANGLYAAWRRLALFDAKLNANNNHTIKWLKSLPESSGQAVVECLLKINIPIAERELFLTLLLTTLPGWAAHIKYRIDWNIDENKHQALVTQEDYLAIRIIITSLLWNNASSIIEWHTKELALAKKQPSIMEKIIKTEEEYRLPLLKELTNSVINNITNKLSEIEMLPEAQLVFCIDIRSEQFRRNLESIGNYETFGFAGSYGVPVYIENEVTGESYASCPVLIKPKHKIRESLDPKQLKSSRLLNLLRLLYQSVSYTFVVPFIIVETLGLLSGIWIMLKTFFPNLAEFFKNLLIQNVEPYVTPISINLDPIPVSEQYVYAELALRAIGLTKNFAPLVVLCGHGSAAQNNSFASVLNCGACGGRHGISNARILAAIMNNLPVREYLRTKGIEIPDTTRFVAAAHNTATDELLLHTSDVQIHKQLAASLKLIKKGIPGSRDWAELRPEWGLAGNATFIVGPRYLTKNINLEGRAFLHSYDYRQDLSGKLLTFILTSPMLVAHWINMQYLFSTLDNIAYGAGSSISTNITGKVGVMQGNASDLMHGIPLQLVYSTNLTPYHKVLRLITVIYAPRFLITGIIKKQAMLTRLVGNGWVSFACIDPEEKQCYLLQCDFKWKIKEFS